MTITDAMKEGAPTFEEWIDEQDFDYQRTESKVVDYVNETVDYENVESLEGWSEYLDQCGIEEESEKAAAAKKQITAVTDRRRRLE